MYNLGTVFRFEVTRTLKKKSFWIMAAAFPIIIGLVFMIVFFSNQATNKAAADTKDQKFSFVVTDESGVVDKSIIQQFGATETTDKQAAIDNVISGTLDAYFYYPKDLTTAKVQIYAKDAGLFDNGRYQAVAQVILQQSVASTVAAQTKAILQNTIGFDATTYKDGVQFDGFKQLIAPGIFLILFYILIAMFGNQMLASTTEEKENRVIEMILTTIKARTLITGKILSLLILALIQVVVILTPVILAYILLHDTLALPNIDLNNIPLDPVRIGLAALMFIFSFLFFTGLLVAIGAAVPTAKEAAGFFGVVMICLFGPLYAVTLFFSAPESGLVRFLSFFPLTAPIPLMLRNAVGNLSVGDATIGIIILAVSAVLALIIAVRMFQFGALEYSRRIGLGTIFKKG
jgi:ABC-2 type transport system permease protein